MIADFGRDAAGPSFIGLEIRFFVVTVRMHETRGSTVGVFEGLRCRIGNNKMIP